MPKTNLEEPKLKHCVECGTKIREKAEMCPKCGAKQPLSYNHKNIIKKSKSKGVFGWIFGVLFGLAGFGSLVSGQIISAFILFVFMLILVPPLVNFIKEKTNLKITTGIKIIIIITGLILIGLLSDSSQTGTNGNIEDAQLEKVLTKTTDGSIIESQKYIFEPFTGKPTINKCVNICYESVGIDASYAKDRCKEFCRDISYYKGDEGLRDAIDTYQQDIVTKKNEKLVKQDIEKGVYDNLFPDCINKIKAQYEVENKLYSFVGMSNNSFSEEQIENECKSKITLQWINNNKTPKLGAEAENKKSQAIEKYDYVVKCTNITFQKYYLIAVLNNPIITINNFNNNTQLEKIKKDCYNEKEKHFWPEGYIPHVTNELKELQTKVDFLISCEELTINKTLLICEVGNTPQNFTHIRLKETAFRECVSISKNENNMPLPDFFDTHLNWIKESILENEKYPKKSICRVIN